MLFDRFGNRMHSSLFPEQAIVTQASTEAKAKAYLQNVENQMRVETQNAEQGILAGEAQKREQERLNRIAQSQAKANTTGYNKYGYPEVLPVKIREMVTEQALDADAFAQRMTKTIPVPRYNAYGVPEKLPRNIRQLVDDQASKANDFYYKMQPKKPYVENNNETMNMQMPQIKMPPIQIPLPTRNQMMMAGAVPLTYGANALASGGNERWDRTAENTLGNLAGAAAGVYAGRYGGPVGAFVGGLGGAIAGGFVSDRIADQFDPTLGMNNEVLAMQAEEKKQAALSLLNQYLDPHAQAALQRKLMENQMVMSQ